MSNKKEIVKIEEKKAKPLSEFASSTASDIADETKKLTKQKSVFST